MPSLAKEVSERVTVSELGVGGGYFRQKEPDREGSSPTWEIRI